MKHLDQIINFSALLLFNLTKILNIYFLIHLGNMYGGFLNLIGSIFLCLKKLLLLFC